MALEALLDKLSLSCECVDRLYLNAYIPNIQCGGQVVGFLRNRGAVVPSPALLNQMTKQFIQLVDDFVAQQGIPVVRFVKGECKEEVARPYFKRLIEQGRSSGVAMVGIAQEKVTSFKASKVSGKGPAVWFNYNRVKVCVNQYYFYVLDERWGPAFVKVSSYFPFGMRLWLNGHEWVKRGLLREEVIFEELDNGFRSVAEPARLQTLSDQLSADDIQGFFDRWLERLPNPYTTDERKFYSYRLSILQMEFSLTQVFTQPRYGRQFFEELIRENLDMGRPDRVQLAFNRRVTRRTPGRFRTRVITTGVDPSVYVDYKSSKIKQYYKHGRALRTELTINDTYDVGLGKALKNFDALREIGRNVNRRLIEAQCLNSNPQVESSTFADVVLPGMVEGRRTPSLRYGDPRVMAVLTGLCGFFPVVAGFRNRDLWNRVNPLVGEGYTQRQMTHDLKRLRLNGLVECWRSIWMAVNGLNRVASWTNEKSAKRIRRFFD